MPARIKLSGDPAYIYAVGRVRARETRLVDERALRDAAEAADYRGAVEVLREFGYDAGSGVAGLRGMLEERDAELRRFLAESLPRDGGLARYLLIAVDYANLKAALVSRLSGHPFDYDAGGTVPVEGFEALAGGGDPAELPEPLDSLAEELLEEYEEERDPFPLQQGVDRALYQRRRELADEIGLPFLTGYLELETDLVNLAALARCLAAPDPGELARRAFIDGGGLDVSRLREAARNGDREAAADHLRGGDYAEAALPAVEGAAGGLEALGLRGSRLKLDYLARARLAAFGAEPVIAYYYTRRNELELVRFVLIGKLNDLPAGRLKARLGL